MILVQALPEIRNTGHIPQQPDLRRANGAFRHDRTFSQRRQRAVVQRIGLAEQERHRRRRLERGKQPVDRAEIDVARAPPEIADRLEPVLLDGLDHFRFRRLAPVGHAKGAVIRMAAGTPGDLRHFGRCQPPCLAAVKLDVGGQRHMVQVEVQPHADGVGRHKEIHIAILVKFHLGVTGARAETPHHHGGPAALAAHEFGDLVDLGRAEGDDGAAPRQAGQLFRTGKAQHRHALARLEPGVGQHLPQ